MTSENQIFNVFISYQTSDKIVAGKLKQILSNFGINSFLAHDDLEVSVEWQDEILKNIKQSELFICLLSENYLKSKFCMQESGIAIVLNMTIIPLSLDDTISPGFISKIQSKRINPLSPSIEDIIPGLLRWNKNEGIRIITELIGSSNSFRSAESNFKNILPFIDDLSDGQATALIEKILDNSQISGAHLCASDYIPQIVRKYKNLLTKSEYQKLKKICMVYGVTL